MFDDFGETRDKEYWKLWLRTQSDNPTPKSTALKYPSWCCQKCGEPIGWLGRFIFSFLHKCIPLLDRTKER